MQKSQRYGLVALMLICAAIIAVLVIRSRIAYERYGYSDPHPSEFTVISSGAPRIFNKKKDSTSEKSHSDNSAYRNESKKKWSSKSDNRKKKEPVSKKSETKPKNPAEKKPKEKKEDKKGSEKAPNQQRKWLDEL